MDLHPTPFPGKTNAMQKKINSKYNQTSMNVSQEQTKDRQKRVFGTRRCTNVPTKTMEERPMMKKPVSTNQTKSSKPKDNMPNPTVQVSRRTKPKPRVKKDSEMFRDDSNSGKVSTNSQHDTAAVVAPCTPVEAKPSSSKIKANKSTSTPYHSAENCSKCRFDRLETSSYWLQQIKLAESVGKHFASVFFFKLAYESNAEPFRNVRVELKRYVARHGHLSAQTEWREICCSYGLIKEESRTEGRSSSLAKSSTQESVKADLNQENKDLKQELCEAV